MRWLLLMAGYLAVMCAAAYVAGRFIGYGQRGVDYDGED